MQQALLRGHGVMPMYREVPEPAPHILEWTIQWIIDGDEQAFGHEDMVDGKVVVFYLEGLFQGVPMYSCDKMN